jgi:hypothetical protein
MAKVGLSALKKELLKEKIRYYKAKADYYVLKCIKPVYSVNLGGWSSTPTTTTQTLKE